MKTVYVIAVKHLFYYKGNTLNRWEYVQFDEYGYTFFTESVDGARHFYSVDEAQKWFDKIGHELMYKYNGRSVMFCYSEYDNKILSDGDKDEIEMTIKKKLNFWKD